MEDSLIFFLLLFSPLALGAVHAWAYCTVAVFSLIIFYSHFLTDASSLKRALKLPVSVGLLLLIGIAFFSIVPLPENLIKILSPAAYDLREKYMAGPASWQTLSIYPRATVEYLLKGLSYAAVFLVIVAKMISKTGEPYSVQSTAYSAIPPDAQRNNAITQQRNNATTQKRNNAITYDEMPSGFFHTFVTLGALAAILAILVHSVCDFNLHIPANALYFTVILAVIAGLSLTREKYSFDYSFIDRLVNWMIGVGFIVAVFAVLQKFSWNGKIYWLIEKPGAHFGPYINYDHYAGYMEMCAFLAIAYFAGHMASSSFFKIRKIKDRIIWFSSPEANKTLIYLFFAAIMVASLFLSTSRGGIISFAMALVLFAYLVLSNIKKKKRTRLFLSIIFAFLLIVIMIVWFGPEETVQRFKVLNAIIRSLIKESPILSETRPYFWKDTLHLMKVFPLFGTGLGTYSYVFPAYRTFSASYGFLRYAHNDYLQFIAEMGVFAYVFIVAFFVWYVRKLRICLRRLREEI